MEKGYFSGDTLVKAVGVGCVCVVLAFALCAAVGIIRRNQEALAKETLERLSLQRQCMQAGRSPEDCAGLFAKGVR